MDVFINELHRLGITALSITAASCNGRTAFIAIQGAKTHGINFVAEAASRKAPCVIVDADDPVVVTMLPVIKIPQLKKRLSQLAAAFYTSPSKKLAITAVTGTNGKTSITQFIAQALTQLKYKVGVIGTLGMGVWPHLELTLNTTPDAVSLQDFFAKIHHDHIKYVVMEASSIALDAHRLDDTHIETAIFTNLTQDHLDYHQTMENYAAAKARLFKFPGLKNAILNLDDPFGKKLLGQCANHLMNVWSFSSKNLREADSIGGDGAVKNQHIFVKSVQYRSEGIIAQLITPFGEKTLSTSLLGSFNVENCLAVLSWLLIQKIPIDQALEVIQKLQPISGRMNLIQRAGHPAVVIDYAHTPDALAKVLQSLRAHTRGKIWCVFGCGGDRDVLKRPLMGETAHQYADEVIITSDNPRNENPQKIADAILAGAPKARIILDRPSAVAYAMQHANPEDMVCIAGKGHETYQEIKGQRLPMCDTDLVMRVRGG